MSLFPFLSERGVIIEEPSETFYQFPVASIGILTLQGSMWNTCAANGLLMRAALAARLRSHWRAFSTS